MKEQEILYQNGDFWVCKGYKNGQHISYEVYKDGVTHATRCAVIGLGENHGLQRAINEAAKLAGDFKSTKEAE